MRTLRRTPPSDAKELGMYVETFLGLKTPGRALCAGHDAPLQYLSDAFFERCGDCVVWAPRGGGKTTMAAALTVLESVFRPGCQTRILGGSERQSSYVYEHFARMAEGGYGEAVAGRIGSSGTRFRNGSEVEILTQSMKAVRGVHVPRLRLDEVEEFKEEVLEAALFVPMSLRGMRGRV